MHADTIQFTSSVGARTGREYLFDGHTVTGRLIADLVGGVSYLSGVPNGNRPDLETQLRARNSCRIAAVRGAPLRLVKVRAWDLLDEELDDLAAECSTTEPDCAAELRCLKAWRREHPASPLKDKHGRASLVLR
jgi:hypothetical protein